jgi:hypothetical protein
MKICNILFITKKQKHAMRQPIHLGDSILVETLVHTNQQRSRILNNQHSKISTVSKDASLLRMFKEAFGITAEQFRPEILFH